MKDKLNKVAEDIREPDSEDIQGEDRIVYQSERQNENKDGGADMAEDLKNKNGKNTEEKVTDFGKFVKMYGVDKAVARGLRVKLKLKADGSVAEEKFVEALKEFTSQKPR